LTSISGVLVTIAAAAGVGLFYLSQSTHVAAIGYQIDALQAQVDYLRAEQQQLTFQIGEARSPSTIEARAHLELRLVVLDPAVIRFASRTIDPHLLK
jgi:Septum formation initiator.